MAYSQGGTIAAADYNTRAADINNIWATGSGANGYGQASALSSLSVGGTVAAGTTSTNPQIYANAVSATNWAGLISRIDAIKLHQSGAASGLSQPTAGSTITFLSTLDANITACVTNKLTVNSRGTGVTVGNPQISNATAWAGVNTKEVMFNFTSTDTVRYFFNAGGYISMSCQQTGGSTSKYVYWNAFLANVIGTFYIASNFCGRSGTGGTATVSNTGVGYWNLTTTYQRLFLIYQAYGIADYNANYVDIYAKITAANQVSLICYMVDNATDTFNDNVDGTNATYTSYVPPETTYLANTWGAVTNTTITNTQ